jgi:Na+/H+ antiporter NhaC
MLMLYYAVLYCSVLYYTTLHCIILYYTVLYYTMLGYFIMLGVVYWYIWTDRRMDMTKVFGLKMGGRKKFR